MSRELFAEKLKGIKTQTPTKRTPPKRKKTPIGIPSELPNDPIYVTPPSSTHTSPVKKEQKTSFSPERLSSMSKKLFQVTEDKNKEEVNDDIIRSPLERDVLFTKPKSLPVTAEQIRLPNTLMLSSSKDNGDCFFESIAAHLPGQTVKSLRTALYGYYFNNREEVEDLHTGDYVAGAKVPGYENILFTAEEMNGEMPIWGRPHVEGKLLCKIFNLPGILAIEIMQVSGQVVPAYYLVTKDGYKQLSADNVPDTVENIPVIAVEQNSLHFVPVLAVNNNSDLDLKNFLQSIYPSKPIEEKKEEQEWQGSIPLIPADDEKEENQEQESRSTEANFKQNYPNYISQLPKTNADQQEGESQDKEEEQEAHHEQVQNHPVENEFEVVQIGEEEKQEEQEAHQEQVQNQPVEEKKEEFVAVTRIDKLLMHNGFKIIKKNPYLTTQGKIFVCSENPKGDDFNQLRGSVQVDYCCGKDIYIFTKELSESFGNLSEKFNKFFSNNKNPDAKLYFIIDLGKKEVSAAYPKLKWLMNTYPQVNFRAISNEGLSIITPQSLQQPSTKSVQTLQGFLAPVNTVELFKKCSVEFNSLLDDATNFSNKSKEAENNVLINLEENQAIDVDELPVKIELIRKHLASQLEKLRTLQNKAIKLDDKNPDYAALRKEITVRINFISQSLRELNTIEKNYAIDLTDSLIEQFAKKMEPDAKKWIKQNPLVLKYFLNKHGFKETLYKIHLNAIVPELVKNYEWQKNFENLSQSQIVLNA